MTRNHEQNQKITTPGRTIFIIFAQDENGMNTLSANLSQPDGTAFTGPDTVSSLPNHYKYQGKEYQPDGFDTDNNNTLDTYLAWSDFDARFFDVQLGRWHVPDPANQHLSPYVGMGNNPATGIDPDGKKWTRYHLWWMWFQKVNNYPAQFDGFSYGGSFWVYEPDEPPAPGGGGGKVDGMVAGGGSRGGAGSRSNQGSANASTPNSRKPSPAQLLAAKEKQKEAQKKKDQLKKELDAEKERKKKAEEAQGQGGGDIAQLFGKYNAGYIADANSNQLFPNQTYDRDKVVTRYMVEGVGVWILGMVNTGLGAVSGGLAVTFQGQEHILRMKAENYLQNGQGLGIYVINVSAPGAFPRAMLFNAVDGSSIGWHHTIVQGAPTMHYHIYLKFLKELNTIR